MSMILKPTNSITNNRDISTIFSYLSPKISNCRYEIDGFSNEHGIFIDGIFYEKQDSKMTTYEKDGDVKPKEIKNYWDFSSMKNIGNHRRILMNSFSRASNGYNILLDNGYIDNNIPVKNFEQEKDELEQVFLLIKKSFDSFYDFEKLLKDTKESKKEKTFNNYLGAVSAVYNSYIDKYIDSNKEVSPIDRFQKIYNETNFVNDLESLSKAFSLSISTSNTKKNNKTRNPLDIQFDEINTIIDEYKHFLTLSSDFIEKSPLFERTASDYYNNPKDIIGKKHLQSSSFYRMAKSKNSNALAILSKLEEQQSILVSYQNKILDGDISKDDVSNYINTIEQIYSQFKDLDENLTYSCLKFSGDYNTLKKEAQRCKRDNKLVNVGIEDFSDFEDFGKIYKKVLSLQSQYNGKKINMSIKDIVENQQKVDENQIENVEKIPEVEKSLRDLLNGSNVENMDAQDRSKYLNYINTTLDEYANFFYKVNTNSGTKAFTRNIDPFLQQELNNYLNSRETHALNRIEYMTKDEILDGFNQVLSRAKQIEQTPYKVEFADAILNNSNLDNEYRGLVCFEKYVNSRNNSGFDNTLKDYFETQVQKNELNLLYLKLDELERQNNDNKYNELREQLVELSNTGVPISPHNFFIACDKLNIDIAPSKEYIAKMRAYATLQSIAIVDNSDSFFVYGKNEASVDEKIMTLNEIFSSEDPEKAIESKLLDNIKEWQTAMDKEPSFKNLAEALEQANENMEIDIPYGDDKLNFGQFYEEIIRSEATKTYFDKILQESINSPFLMNNLFIDKVSLEKRKELYVELEKNHIVRRLVSEGAIDGVIEISENTRDNLKDILSIRKALSDRINNDALGDIEKTNMHRLINIIDNTCLDTMFYSNEMQYKNSNIEILTRDKVLELKKQISTIQANSEKELETISNIKFSNKDSRGLIFIKGEMENNSIKDFNEEFVNSLSEDNLETISFILNLEGDEISKEDIQNALGDKNLLEIRKTDGTFIISSLGNKNENEISALAKEYISKAADKCPKELYKQVDIQEENSLIVSEYKNLVNKAFAKDIQRNINEYGMEINNLVKNEEELTKIVLDRLSKDENKDIKALLDNKFKGIENSPVSYWSKNVFSRENIEKMDLSKNELDSIEKLKTIIRDTSDKYATTHEYKDDVRDYDSIKEDLTKLIVAHKDSTNFELLLGSLITPNGLQKISGVDESLAKDWIDFCQKHGNENAISLYNACKQIFEENKIHIKQIVEVTTEETPQPILNETNENNPINLEDSSSDKNEVENNKPSKEDVAKNLTILNENASKEISIDNGKSISNETNIVNIENELPIKEDIVTKDSNNINVSEILDEVIDNINKQNETMCKNLSNIATQNMDWETVEKIIKVRKDNENFMNKVGRFREKIEQQIADSVNISDFNDISKEKLVKEIESKLNYIYTSNNKSISDISISIKDENEKEIGTVKWDMISKEIEDNKEISKETEKENDNEIEKTSKNGLDLND